MNNYFTSVSEIGDELFQRYPQLNTCKSEILSAYEALRSCYANGGAVYIAGNGGSAADSEHIVGELMKSFMAPRPVGRELRNALQEKYGQMGTELSAGLEGGLPAVSLPSLMSVSTAFQNDSAPENIYAQLISVLGRKGDIFWGISTSGNSANIIKAAMVAKAGGLQVISLCGEAAAGLDEYSDIVIHVPETETFKAQELHLPIYHALCAMLESYFFKEQTEG